MKVKSESISFIIVIFCVTIGFLTNYKNNNEKYEEIVYLKDISSYKEVSVLDKINESFNKNYKTYNFYADMFGIKLDVLKENIIKDNEDSFNELDLLNSGLCNDNLDKSLLLYIQNLEKNNNKLFTRTLINKQTNKDYIYSLIDYFCNIYGDVDSTIAKSIAYIESGNLSAGFMMKKNNIFGGMNNGVLYSYSSIEYGVYRYISLLSNSYFKKGLNTVELIGYKYNPTVINGKKVANPHWISSVNSVKKKFSNNINLINIEELLEV